MAASDLPDLADVQMHREDPTSLTDDVVTITWTDGCRVQVLATKNDTVALRTWWRDGAESDWENLKYEISPARVATCILDAYFAEVANPAEFGHVHPSLQDKYPRIYAILTE